MPFHGIQHKTRLRLPFPIKQKRDSNCCEFITEIIQPRFYDVDQELRPVFDGLVTSSSVNLPPRKSPFSAREIIIFRLLAQKGTTAAQITQFENMTLHIVRSYNKELLRKGREYFKTRSKFKIAHELALYMKEIGLLKQME